MITYESEGLQAKPLFTFVWCWNEVDGVIYRTSENKIKTRMSTLQSMMSTYVCLWQKARNAVSKYSKNSVISLVNEVIYCLLVTSQFPNFPVPLVRHQLRNAVCCFNNDPQALFCRGMVISNSSLSD